MARSAIGALVSALLICAPAGSARADSPASPGEKEALALAPRKEPALEPLTDIYKRAMGKPARDLTKQEAAVVLAFLHHAGFVQLIHGFTNKDRKAPVIEGETLKWPSPAERVGFGPWVKFKDGGEPLPAPGQAKVGPIAGHVGFVVNEFVKRKMTREQLKQKSVPSLQLDPRSAVALYRTANWVHDAYGCTEIHHAGVNGALPKVRNDCHGQGRALDFAGVTCRKFGKDYEFFVYHDWGRAKVPTPGKAPDDWPNKSGVSTYRLADKLEDEQPSAARFFWDFFKYLATQWRPGPTELPRSFSQKLAGGFIMHPDHYVSAPGGSSGREKHKNHIHVQIGETGPDKPGAGM
jgi:hypothetical protein